MTWGVKTEIAVGFAAWRVGQGDGDVILHIKTDNMIPQPGALPYHAWLVSGNYIIDFTTYQLKEKARLLDNMDGGNTQVDWCPQYLLEQTARSRTINDVTQLNAGMFNYTRDLGLEKKILSKSRPMAHEDLCNFALFTPTLKLK